MVVKKISQMSVGIQWWFEWYLTCVWRIQTQNILFFRGCGGACWGWKPESRPCQTLILPLSRTPNPTCQFQNAFQVLVKEIQSLMKRNFQNEANFYSLASLLPSDLTSIETIMAKIMVYQHLCLQCKSNSTNDTNSASPSVFQWLLPNRLVQWTKWNNPCALPSTCI